MWAPLIGVVIGGVITYVVTTLNEARRQRWDARRAASDRRLSALYSLQEHIPPLYSGLYKHWRIVCGIGSDRNEARAIEEIGTNLSWVGVYAARVGDEELDATVEGLRVLAREIDKPTRHLPEDAPQEERLRAWAGTDMLDTIPEREKAVTARVRALIRDNELD